VLVSTLARALAGAERVAVLGVGHELRRDDGVGVVVARRVNDLLARAAEEGRPRIGVCGFEGGPAPESSTGALRRFAPTHVIIVDAADMGENPGTARLVSEEAVAGTGFSTHSMPLTVLSEYLRRSLGCSVVLLGIQPLSIEFGEGLSGPVGEAADVVARAVVAACAAAARSGVRGRDTRGPGRA